MYQDKTLVCKDCNEDFVFSAGEQEFFAEHGFEELPKRCKSCQQTNKMRKRANRILHESVCSACEGVAMLPFEPREDRPVYCSECFAKLQEETVKKESH